jgi:hypothetical protein
VLVIRNTSALFQGFATNEAADAFWERMRHITAIWCCNHDGGFRYKLLP